MLFPTPTSTIRCKRPSFFTRGAAQRVPVPTAIGPGGRPEEEEDETLEDTDPVLEEDDFEDDSLSEEEAEDTEWEPEEEQEGSSGTA